MLPLILSSACTGVHDDDNVLSAGGCVSLPFMKEESIITEKLDGGNCSIYQGKVGGALCVQVVPYIIMSSVAIYFFAVIR